MLFSNSESARLGNKMAINKMRVYKISGFKKHRTQSISRHVAILLLMFLNVQSAFGVSANISGKSALKAVP